MAHFVVYLFLNEIKAFSNPGGTGRHSSNTKVMQLKKYAIRLIIPNEVV